MWVDEWGFIVHSLVSGKLSITQQLLSDFTQRFYTILFATITGRGSLYNRSKSGEDTGFQILGGPGNC